MNESFRLERLMDASPEELFDALTDPVKQREWWDAPTAIVRTTGDVRVGGKASIEWGASEDGLCRADQTYIEIDRPHRLVYTEVVTENNAPVYECVLTFTFEDVGGKTRLVLEHTGFPSVEERDKHLRGTGVFLDRLERYLAAR